MLIWIPFLALLLVKRFPAVTHGCVFRGLWICKAAGTAFWVKELLLSRHFPLLFKKVISQASGCHQPTNCFASKQDQDLGKLLLAVEPLGQKLLAKWLLSQGVGPAGACTSPSRCSQAGAQAKSQAPPGGVEALTSLPFPDCGREVGLSQRPMEGRGDSVSALLGLTCGFYIVVGNMVLRPGWRGRDPSSVRFASTACSKWNTRWWFSTLADTQCYLGSFENTHSQRLFTVTYPAYSTVPGTQDMHYVKLLKCMGNIFCLSRLSRKVRRYSLLASHLYTNNPE